MGDRCVVTFVRTWIDLTEENALNPNLSGNKLYLEEEEYVELEQLHRSLETREVYRKPYVFRRSLVL